MRSLLSLGDPLSISVKKQYERCKLALTVLDGVRSGSRKRADLDDSERIILLEHMGDHKCSLKGIRTCVAFCRGAVFALERSIVVTTEEDDEYPAD